ncbi:MAG TPA: AAA family ATPase [Ktedonobacterales bacterium]|nr:AAA family ATPase [Ktedonobacterales bacterium]
MTTHLSARLAWHDRGWDGTVCAAPHLNASCISLRHVRKGRNDERERKAAGATIATLPGWQPPCMQDAAAYAPRGYHVTYRDPLERRALPSAHDILPPYSCSPSPYRWLREENLPEILREENLSLRPPGQPRDRGWVAEADRQRTLLVRFWRKIEPGKSLIFYYCNQGNPVDEDTARIIVGVGRISEVGPQLYFGEKRSHPDQYPVWPRRVTQDYPQQGVRIPYHEYLAVERPVSGLACAVPASALLPFSYVGEHVSDDIAVAILERVIQSIQRVRDEGFVAGDWDGRLTWLNDALAEVWSGRGAFPGLGSVLQFLGFEQGTIYQREVLAPLAREGANPWALAEAALTGRLLPASDWAQRGLRRAGERWRELPASRRELLTELARFELTAAQVRRIVDPEQRVRAGLARGGVVFSDAAITQNPYVIAESYLGANDTDCVALETVDHGMRPDGEAAAFPRVAGLEPPAHDDQRRVRAVAHAVLDEAAARGDTLLPLTELLARVRARFPEGRACLPDRDVMAAEAAFYQDDLWITFDEQPALAALNRLRRIEEDTSLIIRRLAPMAHAVDVDAAAQRAALEALFGAPATERARAALEEKVAALETLLRGRISVLTGGAGTGKTSVLRAFLAELARLEGAQPLQLLAPTGKARVRLARRTGHPAMTIHQYLLKQGWLAPDTLALRESNDRDRDQLATLIIDECSMIPADLLGTLLRALDLNALRRIVLVGDPNQLPPIGPGRPFVDIIAWMSRYHPERVATLRVCMRTDEVEGESEEESVALTLAEGYRDDGMTRGDDEVLAVIARGESRGDLDVVFWRDHDDLLVKLKERMAAQLAIAPRDQEAFDRSLGAADRNWSRCEAWQILSPTRTQPYGADELNHRIQREYRGRLVAAARNPRNGLPRPAGEQEIVAGDKVIQVVNRWLRVWSADEGTGSYVANGEIGMVSETVRGPNGPSDTILRVGFSTQSDVTYRYWSSEVYGNLELAYALTVHKAQGSDFDTVFLIVPRNATTLSRELIYTGLTRFRKRLVLLIERDISPLLALRSPARSATQARNTFLFGLSLRSDGASQFYPDALIHRTSRGVAVRSKSEVIVADILDSLGASYEYEKPLRARDNPADFRLPDFTVSYEGAVYFWEHLGMLALPSYRDAWERKRAWYEANGYAGRLIVSRDGPNGSIDAETIEQFARDRIIQRR